jgi:hypothetical protein
MWSKVLKDRLREDRCAAYLVLFLMINSVQESQLTFQKWILSVHSRGIKCERSVLSSFDALICQKKSETYFVAKDLMF